MSENERRVSAIPPHLQVCGHSSKVPGGDANHPVPTYSYWLDEGVEEFVSVHFGIQRRWDGPNAGGTEIAKDEVCDSEVEEKVSQWISLMNNSMTSGDSLPDHWELGWFDDGAGYRNQLFSVYWSDVTVFRAWKEKHGADFWNATIDPEDPIGVYEELFFVRPVDFETIYSSTGLLEGVARLPGKFSLSRIIEHGYTGAFRSRIPRAQREDLKALDFPAVFERELEGNSKRVVIRGHENLCVIHSGQNLTDASNEARAAYGNYVAPVLRKCEQDKQSDNRTECYVNRLVIYDDENGVPVRTVSRSYWRDVHALGEWTKGSIHELLKSAFGELFEAARLPGVELWHEVFAMGMKAGQAASRFEYIGCHDETGLLDPYLKRRFGPVGSNNAVEEQLPL